MFALGNGPIFIESLDCHGSEQRLLDCTEVNLRRQLCTHDRDISIRCTGRQSSCVFIMMSMRIYSFQMLTNVKLTMATAVISV